MIICIRSLSDLESWTSASLPRPTQAEMVVENYICIHSSFVTFVIIVQELNTCFEATTIKSSA